MANGRMIAAAAAKRAMQQEATTTPTTIDVTGGVCIGCYGGVGEVSKVSTHGISLNTHPWMERGVCWRDRL